MNIIELNVEDIKEYKNNAKIHTTEQIQQIVDSINEFGFNDPIAVDENNVIIEGHGRYLAIKKLGLKTIPVIKLKHFTALEKKAYIIAHNKINLNTGFDYEELQKEMKSIIANEVIDFEKYGFIVDNEDIEELNNELASNNKKLKSNMLKCPCCNEIYNKKDFKEVLDG